MSANSGVTVRKGRRKRTLYLLLALTVAATLLTLTPLSATLGEITGLTIAKPGKTPLTVTDSELKVVDVELNYNAYTDKWTYAVVTIKNTGSTTLSGYVYIFLYASDGTQIATGSSLVSSVSANAQVDVTVALTWASGYGVDDVVAGDITVVPT
jgi:hypothetical protein